MQKTISKLFKKKWFLGALIIAIAVVTMGFLFIAFKRNIVYQSDISCDRDSDCRKVNRKGADCECNFIVIHARDYDEYFEEPVCIGLPFPNYDPSCDTSTYDSEARCMEGICVLVN